MKRKYLPMFSTYRELQPIQPEGNNLYFGLSAPFPVSGKKMLEETLKTARLAGLDLVFVGFFDPLMEKNSDGELNGGFQGVKQLAVVSDGESFGLELAALARRRGISLLYAFESKKEGE